MSNIARILVTLALGAALSPISALADTVETEILHNNVYQVAADQVCTNGSACTLAFPPTDHIQTVITSVSCSVGIQSTATLNYANLYYGGFTDFVNHLPIVNLPYFYYVTSNGRDTLGINVNTTYFIPKGHAPIIEMNTNGNGGNYLSYHCTLSGYHS